MSEIRNKFLEFFKQNPIIKPEENRNENCYEFSIFDEEGSISQEFANYTDGDETNGELTPEEQEYFISFYEAVDANGDGVINVEELEVALNDFGNIDNEITLNSIIEQHQEYNSLTQEIGNVGEIEATENWTSLIVDGKAAEGLVMKTSNGKTTCTFNNTTIVFENSPNDVTLRINQDTGELEIIGAKNAEINLAENQSLTVTQSTVKEIQINNKENSNLPQSDKPAEINIVGAMTSVNKIVGNNASQIINVRDGAYVAKIETKGGDDIVNFDNVDNYNTNESYIVNTGDGNDQINIVGSQLAIEANTGAGSDDVTIDDSTVSGKKILIENGEGQSLTVKNSEINVDIEMKGQQKNVTFENTQINNNLTLNNSSDSTKKDTIKFDNLETDEDTAITISSANLDLDINNSNLNKLSVQTSNKNSTVDLTGSKIEEFVKNGGPNYHIEFNDSVVINRSNLNENRTTGLDLTLEEYSGYKKIEGNIDGVVTITTDKNGAKVYTFADNSTIILPYGELYINENGEIIINNADNAIVNHNGNLTLINSQIKTYNAENGNITLQNSYVETLNATDSIINIEDNSEIKNLNAKESNVDIYLTSGSIETITAKSVQIYPPKSNQENQNIEEKEIGTIKAESIYIGNTENDKAQVELVKVNKIELSKNTDKGEYNIELNFAQVDSIENKNENGLTTIDLNSCTVKNIVTYNNANYNISNSTVSGEIKKQRGSQKTDNFNINNSTINTIYTSGHAGNQNDTLVISGGSKIEKIITNGEIAITDSIVNNLELRGDTNLAVRRSNVYNIARESGKYHSWNIYSGNYSFKFTSDDGPNIRLRINGKIQQVPSNLGNGFIVKTNASFGLQEKSLSDEINANEVVLNANITNSVIEYYNNNPNADINGTIEYFAGIMPEISVPSLEMIDDNYDKDQAMEIKQSILAQILEIYSGLRHETIDETFLEEINGQLTFANQMFNNEANITIDQTLEALNYMSLYLDYYAYCENGPLKWFISGLNNGLGIGTTQKEVDASIEKYKQQVNDLTQKWKNGELTPVEFAIQYKLITGHELTETNVNSLVDTSRGNEIFDSETLEKIADYKDTTNRIYQVGEYIIVLGVGIVASAVTGGMAAPVIGAMSKLASMGVALTSTTCSLAVKATLAHIERNHNAVNYDDYLAEDFAKDALMMYLGAAGGQLGNWVEGLGKEGIWKVLSWIGGEVLDISIGVGGTLIVTGNFDLGGEIDEEIKSLIIGLTIGRFSGKFISRPVANWKAAMVGQTLDNGTVVKRFNWGNGGQKYTYTDVNGNVKYEYYNKNGILVSVETETVSQNGTKITETATPLGTGVIRVTTEKINNDGTSSKYHTFFLDGQNEGGIFVDDVAAAKLENLSPETLTQLYELQSKGYDIDTLLKNSDNIEADVRQAFETQRIEESETTEVGRQETEETSTTDGAQTQNIAGDELELNINGETTKLKFSESIEVDGQTQRVYIDEATGTKYFTSENGTPIYSTKTNVETGETIKIDFENGVPTKGTIENKNGQIITNFEYKNNKIEINGSIKININELGKYSKIFAELSNKGLSPEKILSINKKESINILDKLLKNSFDISKLNDINDTDFNNKLAKIGELYSKLPKENYPILKDLEINKILKLAELITNENIKKCIKQETISVTENGDLKFTPKNTDAPSVILDVDSKTNGVICTIPEGTSFIYNGIKIEAPIDIKGLVYDVKNKTFEISSLAPETKKILASTLINKVTEPLKTLFANKLNSCTDIQLDKLILDIGQLGKATVIEAPKSITVEQQIIEAKYQIKNGNGEILYLDANGVECARSYTSQNGDTRYLISDKLDIHIFKVVDENGNIIEQSIKQEDHSYVVVDKEGKVIRPIYTSTENKPIIYAETNPKANNALYDAFGHTQGGNKIRGIDGDYTVNKPEFNSDGSFKSVTISTPAGNFVIDSQAEMIVFVQKYLNTKEIRAAVKNAPGKCVLNIGISADGKIYIGINSVEYTNIDTTSTRLTMGDDININQGSCAEVTLKSISGDNLQGGIVFDLDLKVKGNDLVVSEFPPCSTCSKNFSLWNWIYPPSTRSEN